MTNNVELNTFPDNALDAMALLYVQSQDLAGRDLRDVPDGTGRNLCGA